MSKLTPPAPQYLKRRKEFFEANPKYPGATSALEIIKKKENYQETKRFQNFTLKLNKNKKLTTEEKRETISQYFKNHLNQKSPKIKLQVVT